MHGPLLLLFSSLQRHSVEERDSVRRCERADRASPPRSTLPSIWPPPPPAQSTPPHIAKASEKALEGLKLRQLYEEAVEAGKPADAGQACSLPLQLGASERGPSCC